MPKKIMKSDLPTIVEIAYKIGMLTSLIIDGDLDDLSVMSLAVEREELGGQLEAYGLDVPSLIIKLRDVIVIQNPKGTTLL